MKEKNKVPSHLLSEVSEVSRTTKILSNPGTRSKNPIEDLPKQLIFGTGRRKGLRSFTWKVNNSNTEITRSVSFWHVQSNWREASLLRYLRLKYFWEKLSPTEVQFCFDHPKFLSDVEFNVMLSLLANTELTREEITERSRQVLALLGKKSFFRKLLMRQWDNNVVVIADLVKRSIAKRKSFSGWVRSSSSVGSKSSRPSIPDPFILDDNGVVDFDEFEFLYRGILDQSVSANSLTINFR